MQTYSKEKKKIYNQTYALKNKGKKQNPEKYRRYYQKNRETILLKRKNVKDNPKYSESNKRYCKTYRDKNIEKIKQIDLKYRENNKEKVSLRKKKYKEKNPEKVHAGKTLAKLRIKLNKKGHIYTCEKCLSLEFVEGHHDNYHMPDLIRWLCKKCHRLFHSTHTYDKQTYTYTKRT